MSGCPLLSGKWGQAPFPRVDNAELKADVRARLAGRYAEREAQLRGITGSG